MAEQAVISWLLAGDPSIRWQVLHDLVGADEAVVARERAMVAVDGWGARLLALQDPSGLWGGQLYNGKWLSTTYTLLLLRRMGLEPANPQARAGCVRLLDGGFRNDGRIVYAHKDDAVDVAVTAMVLSVLAYFGCDDARVQAVAMYLVGQQLSDGRWEPYPGNPHLRYAFDTTWLALEGLWAYTRGIPAPAREVEVAQVRGREFLLRHRLWKEPSGNASIADAMARFSLPPRWHCDVLAVLDHLQACGAYPDGRAADAIALIRAKRNPDGRWNLQNRHPGKTYFEMEEVGQPSRWNTLRALRVLRWWESPPGSGTVAA